MPETDVEEDHVDAGLMISNNGQGYPLQIVFMCKRQKRVEILGVRVGDLRSSDMRMDIGKAK